MAFAMDIFPHEVMGLISLGEERRLLESSTIWLCAACETCCLRCPNGIDIAGVMDGLRQIAIASNAKPSESEIESFHRAFLLGIEEFGRTNEPVLIGIYKALTRRLIDDLHLGSIMLLRRKIKLVPKFVRDRKSIAKIFRDSGWRFRRESKN